MKDEFKSAKLIQEAKIYQFTEVQLDELLKNHEMFTKSNLVNNESFRDEVVLHFINNMYSYPKLYTQLINVLRQRQGMIPPDLMVYHSGHIGPVPRQPHAMPPQQPMIHHPSLSRFANGSPEPISRFPNHGGFFDERNRGVSFTDPVAMSVMWPKEQLKESKVDVPKSTILKLPKQLWRNVDGHPLLVKTDGFVHVEISPEMLDTKTPIGYLSSLEPDLSYKFIQYVFLDDNRIVEYIPNRMCVRKVKYTNNNLGVNAFNSLEEKENMAKEMMNSLTAKGLATVMRANKIIEILNDHEIFSLKELKDIDFNLVKINGIGAVTESIIKLITIDS